MTRLVRGQRIKLRDLNSPQWNADAWRFKAFIEAPGMTIDWCGFGLDSAGKLSDEQFFVFYNQPEAPNGAIRWQQESQTEADFGVVLSALPSSIRRIVFTASIDGAGAMNQIRGGQLSIIGASEKDVIASYTFLGSDFAKEKALIVAELYYKDEWRFAAVGQGFEGGLSALLKHFGGVEIVEEAPASAAPATPAKNQAQPPNLPPSPTSPPALVSIPVSPPAVPQSVGRGGSLQALIDAADSGATLALMRDEYQGPVRISKPLTLAARGSVIWAAQGPVVEVNSLGVVLRDMEIEVTVPEEATGEGDVALKCSQSAPPRLENVRVRGRVVGMSEDGDWSLPPTLHLGQFAPRVQNDYRVHLRVPVECRLQTPIAGLQLQPAQLAPGSHEVTLLVDGVAPETLLMGNIEIHSATVTRAIPLTGNTLKAEGVAPARQVVLWKE